MTGITTYMVRIYYAVFFAISLSNVAICQVNDIIPTEPFSSPGIRTSDFAGAEGYAAAHDSVNIVITGNLGGYGRAALALSDAYYYDLYDYCSAHESPLCSGNIPSYGRAVTQEHLLSGLLSRWINVWGGSCSLVTLPRLRLALPLSQYTPDYDVNPDLKKFVPSESQQYNLRTDRKWSHPVVGAIPFWSNKCNGTPYYVKYSSTSYDIRSEAYVTYMKDGKMYGTRPTPIDVDGTEYGLLPVKTCRDDAVLFCCLNNLYLRTVIPNQKFPAHPHNKYQIQFDWYKINDSSDYEYIKFTTTKLDDPYDAGSVYVFTDKKIAETCTNFTAVSSKADCVCSLKNALSGFNFQTKGNDEVMLCVAQPDFDFAKERTDHKGGWTFQDYVIYESANDDPQKWSRITKYRFKLEAGHAPPEPEPEVPVPEPEPTPTPEVPEEPKVFTPIIYTNSYMFTVSDCLVREGMTLDVSVKPVTEPLSDVVFHLVTDGTSKGTMTIPAKSKEKQSCKYTAPTRTSFDPDYTKVLHIENYQVNAQSTVTIRDIFVEYAATERKYYDDDGTRLFPESGMWFVDRDHIMRCVGDDDYSVMTVNARKSGVLEIRADRPFTLEEYDSTSKTTSIQTNFIESASGSYHTRNIEIVQFDKPSGTPSRTLTSSYLTIPMSQGKAVRITAQNESKFKVFKLN